MLAYWACRRSGQGERRASNREGAPCAKRPRGRKLVQLHTLNVSLSWARATDYLEHEVEAAVKEGFLPVVCIQEHGKAGDWYHECAGSLGSKGWKCCGAAALQTCAKGTSSGVAVLVPACVEVRLAPGQLGWDISPVGSSGRLCLMLAKLCGIGWAAVFSAY